MMNIQKMMKQAQEMQAKLGQAQAQLEAMEFEGQAASGSVKITISGKGHMLKVNLDPSVMDDKEMLEDLILVAHKDAKEKMDSAVADAMGNVTGGLQLPPGMKLPF